MGELIDFKAYKARRRGENALTRKWMTQKEDDPVVIPFRRRTARKQQLWDFSKILQDSYRS